jgi:hypothetical protein
VESLEKKRVEFLMSAKKCKRVRKNLNTKGIARNEEHRLACPEEPFGMQNEHCKLEGAPPPYIFETI